MLQYLLKTFVYLCNFVYVCLFCHFSRFCCNCPHVTHIMCLSVNKESESAYLSHIYRNSISVSSVVNCLIMLIVEINYLEQV